MGVHYRFDSTEGMRLGETIAVRILHQVLRMPSFSQGCLHVFVLFCGRLLTPWFARSNTYYIYAGCTSIVFGFQCQPLIPPTGCSCVFSRDTKQNGQGVA